LIEKLFIYILWNVVVSVCTVKYRLAVIDVITFTKLHSARISDIFLNITDVFFTPEFEVRIPEHVIVFAISYLSNGFLFKGVILSLYIYTEKVSHIRNKYRIFFRVYSLQP
jgi:hypothetical protein